MELQAHSAGPCTKVIESNNNNMQLFPHAIVVVSHKRNVPG